MTGAERKRKFRGRQKLKDPGYPAKESARIENMKKQRNPQEEGRKSRESSAAWRAKKRKEKYPSTLYKALTKLLEDLRICCQDHLTR